MDVREKYVIQKVNRKEKSICPNCIHHNLCIAEDNQPCFECNRFIDAHGVTVQEWISVNDRLPDGFGEVLVIVSGKPQKNITLDAAYELAEYDHGEGWIIEMWPEWEDAVVTHWMPLPQPPKGE